MLEYTNSEIRKAADEIIHNEKYRAIIIDRLTDGLTYDRLAEKHEMSPAQVKRICYKTGEKVFAYLYKIFPEKR